MSRNRLVANLSGCSRTAAFREEAITVTAAAGERLGANSLRWGRFSISSYEQMTTTGSQSRVETAAP